MAVEAPEPTPNPTPPEPPTPVYAGKRDPSAEEVLEAGARLLALALSARALLFVALLGAIGLCAGVLAAPTVIRLLALCAYAILTIVPLTYLEKTKGRT